MAFKPIQILINAKDEASSVFDRLSGKVAAVGAAVASYFGIKAFVGGVQGAADLESAISRVASAADGGAEELAALRKAAEDAGATTAYSSTEAAGALENLVKAGLSANEAIGALPATMNLAQAGDIELAQSAEIVTKAMAGMGLGIQDAARIADVLAKGANATNTSVNGLAEAFSYVAPVAKSSNLSLESTVAILGKMADAGIDASRSGAALSNILAQFSDPASKFRSELAAIGITTNNFEQALSGLGAAGARGEKAILAIGLNAGPGLRALLNQGMPALDALKASLQDAEGAAAATARTMQDNLNGSLKGLGNVWESVKNTLLTPVLPALKDGVDQLAAALRGAISDGTVQKFGTAIATAFQGAIAWAKEFAGSFNWDDISARLQAFADEVAARMAQIGQYASTAGATVQTAWGVMAGGTQTLLGIIYKIGEAFTTVASSINDGAAWIAERLSKITFGEVSKNFAAAAAEMRTDAGAFGAAADALAAKAAEAFDAAAGHAQTARDGFATLTDTATEGAARVVTAARDMAGALTGVGTAATQVGDQAKAAADQQARATEAARLEVKRLREEYDQAVNTGNWQRAVELMGDLKRATDAAAGSAQDLAAKAQDAARVIEAAFTRAGIQTKEQLADAARLAQNDFDLIKNSGQATAEGIAQAFKRAAEAAIAANDGIVPGWVQAQAAAQGYTIAVDAAGKATLQTAENAGRATRDMAGGWNQVTQATREATRAAQDHQRQMDQKYGRAGQSESLSSLEGGWAKDEKGNTIGQTKQTWLSIYNMVKGMGLSEQQARGIADQAYPNGRYSSGLQQQEMRGKWDAIDVTEAARRAAERMIREGGTAAGVAGADNTGTPGAVAKVVRIEFKGADYDVDTTTDTGRDQLDRLLRDIGRDKRRAA